MFTQTYYCYHFGRNNLMTIQLRTPTTNALLKYHYCSIYRMIILTRCTRGVRVVFSEQECDLIVMLVRTNLLTKLCSIHMTVFEIVVHRNDDTWIRTIIGMMYFDADNSSIDSGRTLAIHSYT